MSLAFAAAQAVPVSSYSLLSNAASLSNMAAPARVFWSLPCASEQDENAVIRRAIALVEQRCFQHGPILNSPPIVREFLQLKLATEKNEVFAVVFLDAQLRVITYEPMFYGTVTQTSVYPRVVAQKALELNACHVILAHNHPSGETTPSRADELLTQTLKTTLNLIDVSVLDHIIVGRGHPYSFAETGLL
jgi:DNA repair protein RadC